MKNFCPYCLESFNAELHMPMKLTCNHVLCNSCIKYLKTYQYPQACPIDNELTDYSSAIPCLNTIEHLSLICQSHKLMILGICMNHIEPLCDMCVNSHQNCLIEIEEYEDLEKKAIHILKKSIEKSQIIDELSEIKCIEEISDGINWTKSEINNKVSDLKKKVKERNTIQTVRKINENDLGSSLILVKERINLIKELIEPAVGQEEKNEIKDVEVFKKEISYEILLEEFLLIGICNDELYKHFNALLNNELQILTSEIRLFTFFDLLAPVNFFQDSISVTVENRDILDLYTTGIIIGTPIDPSGYFNIEELAITLDNNTQKIEKLEIKHKPGRITTIIYLNQIIVWGPNRKITINLFINCYRSYFFLLTGQYSYFTLNDLDDKPFKQVFPVLGFTNFLEFF